MKRILFAHKDDWVEPVRERLDAARYEPVFRDFQEPGLAFDEFDAVVPLRLSDYAPMRARPAASFLIPDKRAVQVTHDKSRFHARQIAVQRIPGRERLRRSRAGGLWRRGGISLHLQEASRPGRHPFEDRAFAGGARSVRAHDRRERILQATLCRRPQGIYDAFPQPRRARAVRPDGRVQLRRRPFRARRELRVEIDRQDRDAFRRRIRGDPGRASSTPARAASTTRSMPASR